MKVEVITFEDLSYEHQKLRSFFSKNNVFMRTDEMSFSFVRPLKHHCGGIHFLTKMLISEIFRESLHILKSSWKALTSFPIKKHYTQVH